MHNVSNRAYFEYIYILYIALTKFDDSNIICVICYVSGDRDKSTPVLR